MMKHLFIVNPVAGSGKNEALISQQAQKAFSGHQDEYEVYITKAPMDACNKIREDAAIHDSLRVYACGGDGTLNECVNGAVGLPHVAVTHFPCGTGNDFVKMFEAEKDKFFDLNNLINGEVRPIDIIDCNGRYCVNICSVGIDARVGTQVHNYGKHSLLGGAAGYVVAMIDQVFKGINRPLKVKCDDKEFSGSMALVCACNGRYYGGGFNPVPIARPDDGLINFLIVKGVTLFEFFKMIVAYAKGKFHKYPQYITHIKGRSIEIIGDEDMIINLDGEAIYGQKIEINVIPDGVNFIFPKSMEFFKVEMEQAQEKSSNNLVSVR